MTSLQSLDIRLLLVFFFILIIITLAEAKGFLFRTRVFYSLIQYMTDVLHAFDL